MSRKIRERTFGLKHTNVRNNEVISFHHDHLPPRFCPKVEFPNFWEDSRADRVNKGEKIFSWARATEFHCSTVDTALSARKSCGGGGVSSVSSSPEQQQGETPSIVRVHRQIGSMSSNGAVYLLSGSNIDGAGGTSYAALKIMPINARASKEANTKEIKTAAELGSVPAKDGSPRPFFRVYASGYCDAVKEEATGVFQEARNYFEMETVLAFVKKKNVGKTKSLAQPSPAQPSPAPASCLLLAWSCWTWRRAWKLVWKLFWRGTTSGFRECWIRSCVSAVSVSLL